MSSDKEQCTLCEGTGFDCDERCDDCNGSGEVSIMSSEKQKKYVVWCNQRHQYYALYLLILKRYTQDQQEILGHFYYLIILD